MACPPCEQEVTSVQQTRALLSSVVADAAAAVDVSGLWDAIDAAVPHRSPSEPLAPPVRAPSSWLPSLGSLLSNPRVGYVGRVWTWGAASACAAAAAFMLFSGGVEQRPVSVASVQSGTVTSGALQGDGLRLASTASSSRGSSGVRVESIEAGRGHSFSTWEQPRSGARVIWVAKNSGARVERASLSR